MKVKDLIEILKRCDPELPIATHANNHQHVNGGERGCRVALLNSYLGDHIIIGNFQYKRLNGENYSIEKEIDGLGEMRNHWRDPII